MPHPSAVLDMGTTAGGFLLVLSLIVPVTGVLLAFAAGVRHSERIAFAVMPLGLAIAAAIAFALIVSPSKETTTGFVESYQG